MHCCKLILTLFFPLLAVGCQAQSQPLPKSEKLSPEKVAAIAERIDARYPKLSDDLRRQMLSTVVRSLDEMVFIEGGEFEMGDFGAPCDFDQTNMGTWPYGYEPDELCPITGKFDDDYLHQVRLSSYYLSSYQVSHGDFDLFRTSQGLTLFDAEYRDREDLKDMFRKDNPAPAKTWQESKNYCLWLGDLSGYPVDLPTEAQWEFAARNRGQYVQYPTDTGSLDYGRNIPRDEQTDVLPLGQFAPSPLGLYDMAGNATDWVNDWYAPDYYRYSPAENPQGPETGVKKIRRGSNISELNWQSANTVRRWADEPVQNGHFLGNSFRCAIQVDQPL
ncbi:MAG: formylglycine-generating enzyme family protein [Gammaproteobacteria bacterium]|nr:formylglycine-generating enzyme family protein [Gammaproteobacteria bacterium]MBU1488836.1 formylglycine-generating enzyme family protein [Gammaproteobacteria bacterium]MBU2066678.1 formylglycine-generating enzyme family protein [Gammaproteobacteria bacterium]MBU2138763.1 formylglycine-generating enzyme family protein [Gammaproteobacteria bacterium]MBU2216106.1 formylglycine-generating enzyme family protein [Gammaproteobacteria bacterium]